MPQQDNVIVARFPDSSRAYQALTMLKNADAEGKVSVRQAMVVERRQDGTIGVPEGTDNVAGLGTATGSLAGMLIGVLGGPVGLLLGWGSGALIGGAVDLEREGKSESGLAQLARKIEPGSTALVAEVRELAVEVIDGGVAKLGGDLSRYPTEEVLGEIEAADDAAAAAAEQADRVVREQKKKARHEKREERIAALKTKLHRADDAFRAL